MIEANDELELDAAQGDALRAFETEAGEVFPQLGAAQAGDEALVAALAERATASVGAPAAASTAAIGAQTIAIVAIFAAVATAGLVAWLASRGDPPDEPARPAAAVAPTDEPTPAPALAPTTEPPTIAAPAPPDEPPAIEPAPKPARERVREPEPAPKADAAELLRQGNEARRAGDHTRARTIYRRIRKDFPGTREDLLVRVSLGQLALDHFSDPSEALAQFGAYLRDKPKGTLAEEASLGRIAALRRLGRKDAERAQLQSFLASFPESIQKDAVAKRLAELGG